MTIEELYKFKYISVRSFNVCNNNGLKDLYMILRYYKVKKTFNNLRNCGKMTNEELISFCLKYSGQEKINELELCKTENLYDIKITTLSNVSHENDEKAEEIKIKKSENALIDKISNLTRTQREIVNSFIEINSNSLTNRSRNAIYAFLGRNLQIRNFSEKVLTREMFDIRDIKNVGKKTTTELNSFFDLIKAFVENVSNTKDENELISMKNRFFIEKKFSISEIPREILDSNSIFKLTDYLLKKNVFFENNKSIIFKEGFKVYQNQLELTPDQIAEGMNISRERVRQIRLSILDDLFTNLQFVKTIDDDLFQKYKIDINQNYIIIDDDLTDFINRSNDTNLSKEFISYLIFVYKSDKFTLLGNIDDVLLPKYPNSRERHNWKYFYLIDRKISTFFQFKDLADDIDKRINERIGATYKFNIKSYLSNFFTKFNLDQLEQVTEITELIINNEFGIYPDLEDNILFTRNSIKQAYEYAYEALKQIGKPAKVKEITSKILELHPEYETDDAKVRASMKRQNGFVPIGRKSVFGLKAWEKELENFKGGTIRSIVLEYLENHLEPQHISNITSYVLKFRPKSNEYSIFQNLKLDESGNFIFFENSYVGLSNKDYDMSNIKVLDKRTVETKTWKERYVDLTIFLNQKGRLPFSSGCPENEIKLYRWYKFQLGKYRKENLDYEKSVLIKNIFEKYEQNSYRKRRTNFTDKYIELMTFVMEKGRLPSANKVGEGNLYQFFYKQRKLYDKGELRPEEQSNFIKVARIIQNNKNEN